MRVTVRVCSAADPGSPSVNFHGEKRCASGASSVLYRKKTGASIRERQNQSIAGSATAVLCPRTKGTPATGLWRAQIKEPMLEEDNVREGFLEHGHYLILRNELPDHQRLILVIGYHVGMRREGTYPWNGPKSTGMQTWFGSRRNRPCNGPLIGGTTNVTENGQCGARFECPFIVAWDRHGTSEIKTDWNKARRGMEEAVQEFKGKSI